MVQRALTRLLLPLVTAATALLSLPACDDGITKTLEPAVSCQEPCDLSFSSLRPQAKNPGEVTIESVGDAPLRILAVDIEGAPASVKFKDVTVTDLISRADWRVSSDTQHFTGSDGQEPGDANAYVLDPGLFLEVGITITPTSSGETGCPDDPAGGCGTLVVKTNSRRTPVLEIPIVVTVAQGRPSITPTVLTFGSPRAGIRQTRSITVTNAGSGDLLLTDIRRADLSTNISWTEDSNRSLPLKISPSGDAVYTIEWLPAADDEQLNGNLLFETNSLTARIVSVNVRSDGTNSADISVTPLAVPLGEAGAGELVTSPIEVCNRGTARLTYRYQIGAFIPGDASTEISLRDGSAADSEPVPFGADIDLEGSNCKLTHVHYNASAARSIRGTLTILSNDPDSPSIDVSVSGGPAAPEIEVAPLQLYFADVGPGSSADLSFVVYNRGRADLTVSELRKNGDFDGEFVPDTTAPFTLAPGASRRITVTYARAITDVGTLDQGSIDVVSDDPLRATTSPRVFMFSYHDDLVFPPTCVLTATPAEPYRVGQAVTLDAASSTPPSGGEWTANPFTWTVLGPAGSVAAPASPNAATTTVTFDVAGTFEVGLRGTALSGGQSANCQSWRSLVVQP
jgi:hypothetical protein